MVAISKIERRFWYAIAGLAVVGGVYFRILGFSAWPLTTDEFYIYRSMTFILESGLPEFPCGGFYARGLLYQYVTAPLLALGLPPELSLRLVTILSNVAMFPAAYLLARRIGDLRVALAMVAVLALSTWEIEMARFGRMYAPFQAVFMWYVYHLYCLMTNSNHRRWRWLLGLSAAAPLVWEGGITLAVLNLLPIITRRSSWRLSHALAALLILGAASVFLLQIEFRYMGPASAKPPAITEMAVPDSDESTASFHLLGPELLDSAILTSTFLLLVIILIAGFARLLPAFRTEPRHIMTVLMLSVATLLNQLLLAIFVLLGASLINWFEIRNVWLPRYRAILLSLIGVALVWITVALGIQLEQGPIIGMKDFYHGVRALISLPDLVFSFLYPWLLSLPLMTLLLILGFGIALSKCLFAQDPDSPDLRHLLTIVLVSLCVIGAAPTSFIETRYAFHLYPLLLLVTIYSLAHYMPGTQAIKRQAARWAPLLFLGFFITSSDFDIRHMLRLNTYEANFRVGYEEMRARQYYRRFDFRTPAEFVNQHARPTDMIVATNVTVTQYLEKDSHVYLHKSDDRYSNQACNFAEMERWTGMPLLDDINEFETLTASDSAARLWLIADQQTLDTTLPNEYLVNRGRLEPVFTAPDQQVTVYLQSERKH